MRVSQRYDMKEINCGGGFGGELASRGNVHLVEQFSSRGAFNLFGRYRK